MNTNVMGSDFPIVNTAKQSNPGLQMKLSGRALAWHTHAPGLRPQYCKDLLLVWFGFLKVQYRAVFFKFDDFLLKTLIWGFIKMPLLVLVV